MKAIKQIIIGLVMFQISYIYALDIYIDESEASIKNLERLQQHIYENYYFNIHFKRLADRNETQGQKNYQQEKSQQEKSATEDILILSKKGDTIILTHQSNNSNIPNNASTSEQALIKAVSGILDTYIKRVHIILADDDALRPYISDHLELQRHFFNIKTEIIFDTTLLKNITDNARNSIAIYMKKHQLSGVVIITKKRRGYNITTQTYGDDAKRVANVLLLQSEQLSLAIASRVLKQMVELNLIEMKNRKL